MNHADPTLEANPELLFLFISSPFGPVSCVGAAERCEDTEWSDAVFDAVFDRVEGIVLLAALWLTGLDLTAVGETLS